MFGRGRSSSLERLAGEAEAIILAMSEAEREHALAGLKQLIAGARSLFALPDALWERLWQMLLLVIAKSQIPGVKPAALIGQILRGAPTLDEHYGSDLRELVH